MSKPEWFLELFKEELKSLPFDVKVRLLEEPQHIHVEWSDLDERRGL